MKPKFKPKPEPSEALRRMAYNEFAPARPDAPCAMCDYNEPGEPCRWCGLPVPLPKVSGL